MKIIILLLSKLLILKILLFQTFLIELFLMLRRIIISQNPTKQDELSVIGLQQLTFRLLKLSIPLY